MEILIIVILVAILIYGLTDKREKKRGKLDTALAAKQAQKDEDANTEIAIPIILS
ncbi:MAG: hypothetical protein HN340_03935 [Candidatus Marinimicrobia bacterium]|jgi:FtsZ-interacting cell division protein ZipA|nr:hypothetical protein [Candidatus Neomarinimicrobiota bacterium]